MDFLTLHDAVAQYVKDGGQVALEGFTHRIPFGRRAGMQPPSAEELEVLRELHARTARAHGAAGGSE